ncbi:MAG: filamentous hemagglutinin N-terminal domain-containing protein, partial [Brachymonas sp.]
MMNINRTPPPMRLPGGQRVQLRGAAPPARRARHSRFMAHGLSYALASAFNAASQRAANTLARLSLTLAGLASLQAQSQAQTANLPQGGVAVHGAATMQQNGTTLNVNTTNGSGNRSIINWQSFNVGAGHTTNINQPNAASSSLNRVVTNVPSQIHGTLRSNGQVILVNQNGIAVGAGGVVDTAGFTASTLNISDADYKAKRLRFEGNSLSGGVQVDGVIRSQNGDVVLFAPNVATGKDAFVKADNGNVIVGAGQSVEVTGRGLEGVKFLIQSADNKAINLGTLQGNAVGVFAGTLRHSGVISAQTATMEGGRVVLRAVKDVEIVKDATLAKAPVIEANGGVNAAGVAQKGGSIQIESNQGNVTIGAGSSITANAAYLGQNQPHAGINAAGGAIEIIANQGRVVTEAG